MTDDHVESTYTPEIASDLAGAPPISSVFGRIARGGITYATVGMFQKLISLAAFPIYARAVTPDEYGSLGVLWSMTAVLSVVLAFGLETAIFRSFFALADRVEERARFLKSVGLFLLVVPNILAVIVALASLPLVSEWGEFPAGLWVLGLLGASVQVSASVLPLAVLRAEERLRDYIKLTTVFALTYTGSALLFVVGLQLGIKGWVIANLGAAMLSLIVSTRIVPIPWTARFERTLIGGALAFGLPLLPHALSHWVLSLSDRVILSAYVASADIGVYTIGYQAGWILGILVAELHRAVMPEYGRALTSEAHRPALVAVVTHQIIVIFVLVLATALVVPPLISLVLPAAYERARDVIPWVALGGLGFGLYLIPMAALTVLRGETRGIWKVTLVAALCNVGLNLWLVPHGGIIIAAVNTAVGYTVLAVLMTVHAVKVGAPVVTPLWGLTSRAGAVVVLGYIVGRAFAPSEPGAELLVESTLVIVVTVILLGMTRILSGARNLWVATTRRRPGG